MAKFGRRNLQRYFLPCIIFILILHISLVVFSTQEETQRIEQSYDDYVMSPYKSQEEKDINQSNAQSQDQDTLNRQYEEQLIERKDTAKNEKLELQHRDTINNNKEGNMLQPNKLERNKERTFLQNHDKSMDKKEIKAKNIKVERDKNREENLNISRVNLNKEGIQINEHNNKDFYKNVSLSWPSWYYCNQTVLSVTEHSEPVSLCGAQKRNNADIVIFTTMYHDSKNMFIFNNTLHLWSQYGAKIQRILVLSDRSIYDRDPDFLRLACSLGWSVILAPECNQYEFPVLASMFQWIIRFWDATWYGYVNGDVVISQGLQRTLDFLFEMKSTVNPNLVIGRRTNLKLPPGASVASLPLMTQLTEKEAYDKVDAEDYFFVLADQFPWHLVLPLVVGRPGFDNWLVWWSQVKMHLNVIDVSHGFTAVHMAVDGSSIQESSHLRRKQEDGFTYNEQLTGSLDWQWDYFKGCTSRTGHVLHYIPGNYPEKDAQNTSDPVFKLNKKSWTVKAKDMDTYSARHRHSDSSVMGIFERYHILNSWNGTVPSNKPPRPPPTNMLRLVEKKG